MPCTVVQNYRLVEECKLGTPVFSVMGFIFPLCKGECDVPYMDVLKEQERGERLKCRSEEWGRKSSRQVGKVTEGLNVPC